MCGLELPWIFPTSGVVQSVGVKTAIFGIPGILTKSHKVGDRTWTPTTIAIGAGTDS